MDHAQHQMMPKFGPNSLPAPWQVPEVRLLLVIGCCSRSQECGLAVHQFTCIICRRVCNCCSDRVTCLTLRLDCVADPRRRVWQSGSAEATPAALPPELSFFLVPLAYATSQNACLGSSMHCLPRTKKKGFREGAEALRSGFGQRFLCPCPIRMYSRERVCVFMLGPAGALQHIASNTQ